MSWITLLGGLAILASLFTFYLVFRKINYIKITSSRLKKLSKQNLPKYVQVKGKVINENVVLSGSYTSGGGAGHFINFLINDGTGKLEIMSTTGFKKWIQKGDKILAKGRLNPKNLSIWATNLENLTTGKKRGKLYTSIISIILLLIGIAGLIIGKFKFTRLELILFVIFLIIIGILGIKISKKAMKEIKHEK